MLCTQCGETLTSGTYFCGSCGKAVGVQEGGAATAVDEVALDDVPAPIGSMERPAPAQQQQKKALCSICLGAYAVEELSIVDGKHCCAGCSRMGGRGQYAEFGVSGGDAGIEHEDKFGFPAVGMHRVESGGGRGRGLKVVLCILLLGLVGGGAYFLVTSLGSDRIDKLLAGVDDGREDAILLVQKFEPGVPLNYEMGFSMHLEMDVDSGPIEEVVLDVGAKMMVLMEPLSVDEQGNADVRLTLRLSDGDISVTVDGEKAALPGMDELSFPSAVVLVMKVDPFGQPIGDPIVENVVGAIVGASDPSKWRIASGLDEVPRHRVKVGDSWTNNATIPFGGDAVGGLMATGNMGGSATMTVEGFKKILGRDCMAMSLDGSMSAGGMGGSLKALIGDLDIDGKLKGAVFFDPDAGVLVKQAVDMDFSMSGSNAGTSMDVRATVSIDLELQ